MFYTCIYNQICRKVSNTRTGNDSKPLWTSLQKYDGTFPFQPHNFLCTFSHTRLNVTLNAEPASAASDKGILPVSHIRNVCVKVWATWKRRAVGLQYAAAQHFSPGPFISTAQAAVFNPSSCFWCSPICHPERVARSAKVNLLYFNVRRSWDKMEAALQWL